MQIAVIGSTGQLAHDLLAVLDEAGRGIDVIGLSHSEVEVSDLTSLRSALSNRRPDVLINTAAFHQVDLCEDEPDRTLAVNAVGARNLALICRELDCKLVHLSTDYVFSGSKSSPYVETDPVAPLNFYGLSKAAGEMAISYLWPKHFIVRSSGLYGLAGSSGKGGNFVETMLRLAREGRDIRVVSDQTLTPTHTRPLAEQILALFETEDYGIYHATCQGACTWHEFAMEIFDASGLNPNLSTQTTEQSGAKATRPACSVLENASLEKHGMDRMPPWRDALRQYLVERASGRVAR